MPTVNWNDVTCFDKVRLEEVTKLYLESLFQTGRLAIFILSFQLLNFVVELEVKVRFTLTLHLIQ
jgi:hypothetical protein